MKPEDKILKLASQHGLSVFFNGRERASGRNWIRLFIRGGATLAEFSSIEVALAWFPETHKP
jgi:hypothetical protein